MPHAETPATEPYADAEEPLLRAGIASRARSSLAAALRYLADTIVPPLCLSCREPLAVKDAICPVCWRAVDFIRPPLCDRLGIPLPFDPGGLTISAAAAAAPPDYDRARAVARYDGVMRDMIHALKYSDRHDAVHLFGRWLMEFGSRLARRCGATCAGAAESVSACCRAALTSRRCWRTNWAVLRASPMIRSASFALAALCRSSD